MIDPNILRLFFEAGLAIGFSFILGFVVGLFFALIALGRRK